MWPVLFRWGPVTLHTYGALVAAGFFLGYFSLLRMGRRHELFADAVTDLIWWLLLAGLAGGRLLFIAFNWPDFRDRPLDVMKIWQGGLVWYGGFFAAAAAALVWSRRRRIPFLTTVDIIVSSAALGHAVGRLGCFAAGCCFGRPTNLPWAVTFRHPETLAAPGVALHPSQLYEAGLNLLLFGALASLEKRFPRLVGTGALLAVYLAGYAVIRWTVEFTRGDDRGPVFAALTATQWIAVFCLAAAAGLFLRRRHD